MNLTRWKAMAGLLALGIGGLAALAEPPSSGTNPKQPSGKSCAECPAVNVPPLPVAVPTRTEVCPLTPVATPAPLVIPTVTTETPVPPVAAASPAPTPAPMPQLQEIEVAPMPRLQPEVSPVEFAIPSDSETPSAGAKPTAPVLNPATPAALTPTTPQAVEARPVPNPAPASIPSQAIQAKPVPPTPRSVPMATTVPDPASSEPIAQPIPSDASKVPSAEIATPSREKKLKVQLYMSDDRPRFEVRDGDEVYLKVICDSVDVKAPNGRADAQTILRASGRCAFVTPGGDGFCDELCVVPGTGVVTVSGNVRFRYQWGRAETEVSGDKLTFRLGSTPGMLAPLESKGHSQPASGVVPTVYSPKP
jgi:hypothetical protein